jgi:hypothetical protein
MVAHLVNFRERCPSASMKYSIDKINLERLEIGILIGEKLCILGNLCNTSSKLLHRMKGRDHAFLNPILLFDLERP